MSEQTPLKSPEENQKVPFRSQAVLEEPKPKSGVIGFFRLLLAAVIVGAGVWVSHQNLLWLDNPLKSLMPYLACVAALIVLMAGNFGRFGRYVRESVKEVKKVVWPERSYTLRMTMFVVAFVTVLAVFIYGVDTLISWLFFDVLMKRG
ncbi:preprotein translocase subunit SecE [Neisseria leonii]|uniref:Protein translocase subunit SecE n=2 Tax=Neisseria leonii TaxID=2995413 RepID=A0A9X4E7V1_9NEIS|nr:MULTISPECIES: preprotein translocase subunit SecE [unclassified Neisseria]MDD9326528.1 preprotein translocase subunit SecE [Neisseria sp. 3986]MDD9328637.1 preprotein translocase subunit SecE [Neisseria sp. 51.81]